MYYIAKGAQLAGLLIISFDFIRKFPNLMSPKPPMKGLRVTMFRPVSFYQDFEMSNGRLRLGRNRLYLVGHNE